jgi:hypothetical protein
MTNILKKNRLIEEVEKLSDSDFFDSMLGFIELESGPGTNKSYPLTKMERNAVEKAEKDIQNGNLLTQEQADDQISLWL